MTIFQTQQLISPQLSQASLASIGANRVAYMYFNSFQGPITVGAGGQPQMVRMLPFPSEWKQHILKTALEMSTHVNLKFAEVQDPSIASISFYNSINIQLGITQQAALGVAVPNIDRRSSRQWFEIFMNSQALSTESTAFIKYILVHEFLHSLGLEHPFDGSDGDFYKSTEPSLSASSDETTMAYKLGPSGKWRESPTAMDIKALQDIWGKPTTSVYRIYNTETGAHIFSALEKEVAQLTASTSKYVNEGIAYRVENNGTQGLYRFYDTRTDRHFYSANDYERDVIRENNKTGLIYEGVVFNVFSSNSDGEARTPIIRYYDPNSNTHFYTANMEEQVVIAQTKHSWVKEGIAWYV